MSFFLSPNVPALSGPLRIGVIVGLDLVGDALIKLPFVRALRAAWPDAQIDWITSKGPTAFSGALRGVTEGLINQVYETPSWMPLAKTGAGQGQAPSYDLLFDTRGRWREALVARRYLARGLFIASAMRYLFSGRRPLPFTPRPKRLIDRLLQMVELAAGYVPPVTLGLPIDPELLGVAHRLMPQGKVYVGFAPGAGNREKVWPLENYLAVAGVQRTRERRPVFLLGPDELAWRPLIEASVPHALFPLQDPVWGKAPLRVDRTLAVASLLDVAVANDSGTGHMLAAVDCPLISLFGPTDAAKLAPQVSRGAVIRAQDFGGETMLTIPVDSVAQALDNVLLFQK